MAQLLGGDVCTLSPHFFSYVPRRSNHPHPKRSWQERPRGVSVCMYVCVCMGAGIWECAHTGMHVYVGRHVGALVQQEQLDLLS